MRRKSPTIIIAIALAFVASFVAYAQLGGADGIRIPYSGQLDVGGAPANGPHDFEFSIYNVAVDGTVCDTHTETALVTGGAFAVVLGPVDENCIRGQDVYLEVGVSTDGVGLGYTTLAGRQRIYAATSATTAGSGDFDVTGNVDVGGTVSAGAVSTGAVSTT